MNIEVMRQIELLGILQEISSYWDLFFQIAGINRPAYTDYQNEARKRFLKYKEHNAVKQFDGFIKRYGVFTPHNYFVNMHADFSDLFPDEKASIASVLINSYCDPNAAMQMQKAIADFIRVSDFESWFYDNTSFHDSLIALVKKNLGTVDCLESAEKHLGIDTMRFMIVPAPLDYGNYGLTLISDTELPISVALKSMIPFRAEGLKISSSGFAETVLHELLHPFINGMTNQYMNEWKRFDKLEALLMRDFSDTVYDNFEACINEYVIRALVLRIMKPIKETSEYERLIAKEEDQGFTCISSLLKALSAFERDNEIYDDFTKFYPMLPGCLLQELENS